MKFTTWRTCIICIIAVGISNLSNAFDVHLTEKQMKEASEYGSKYKGKEVFGSDIVKKARFGEYPNGDGGIIMSKYIRIAVTSAMMALKDKIPTPDDLKEIEESTTFNVVVSVLDEDVNVLEDVQIIVKQGTNNILPIKTEFGMKYKDKRQGIVGVFQCEKVNPNASTAIVVKTRKGEKKYKIDFSDIR